MTEIVDDLVPRHFGQERDDPVLMQGRVAVGARWCRTIRRPSCGRSTPSGLAGGGVRRIRQGRAGLNWRIRRRRLRHPRYDDLLTRLADALKADDSPAQIRMHRRWPIVMVDEFQDTDPVQWQVIDRAFSGRSTPIRIGDPKQAIAFAAATSSPT